MTPNANSPPISHFQKRQRKRLSLHPHPRSKRRPEVLEPVPFSSAHRLAHGVRGDHATGQQDWWQEQHGGHVPSGCAAWIILDALWRWDWIDGLLWRHYFRGMCLGLDCLNSIHYVASNIRFILCKGFGIRFTSSGPYIFFSRMSPNTAGLCVNSWERGNVTRYLEIFKVQPLNSF